MSGFLVEHVTAPTPEVVALIDRHFALMRAQSPEESCHVMPSDSLFGAGIHLCALRGADSGLLGLGALKTLDRWHGEVKSMHTSSEARGLGVGATILRHLLETARSQGMTRVSLETGFDPAFASARRLYERHGFTFCPPFGSYADDPLSVFMTRTL